MQVLVFIVFLVKNSENFFNLGIDYWWGWWYTIIEERVYGGKILWEF